jgi:hypothetical protein
MECAGSIGFEMHPWHPALRNFAGADLSFGLWTVCMDFGQGSQVSSSEININPPGLEHDRTIQNMQKDGEAAMCHVHIDACFSFRWAT